jgi:hypothetical protein
MTEQEARLSLEQYAASGQGLGRPGTQCWACNLPERQEIDEAFKKGTSIGVIRRWLIDVRGYGQNDATRSKLENHRDNHVAR